MFDNVEKALKEAENTVSLEKKRKKVLPTVNYEEVDDQQAEEQKTEYVTLEVVGSKGQKYRVVVPAAYYDRVPKVWQWDKQKYRVAELIAEGLPITQITAHPDVTIKSRMTIYGWLQHPEFKEHIDGLILETGFASKRERIAGLSRVASKMYAKIMEALDTVEVNEKNIVPFINALRDVTKLLAQEKEELVEQSRVEQDTKLSGTVTTTTVDLEQYLSTLEEDEREKMEREFDKIGDAYIRQLRGDITTAEIA